MLFRSNHTIYAKNAFGCITTAIITINALPASPADPTVVSAGRCGTGTVTLTATAPSGSTVYWYDAAGTTQLGSGNSFTTPSISVTTTYKAISYNNNTGCISALVSAIATITAAPTAPTVTSAARCGTGTVTLTATAPSGSVVYWYDATASTYLATGNSYTTPSLTTTTNYTAFSYNTTTGCWSGSNPATATVNAIPLAPIVVNDSRCGTGTVTLTATSEAGTTIQWNNNLNTIYLATGGTYTTPSIAVTTYYTVSAYSAAGCFSPAAVASAIVKDPRTLGNYVWVDANANGLQDAGELPVANVTVKLYADANGDNTPDGAAIATTTTNASGLYNFNTCDAKYVVSIVTPAGYSNTITTATSADPNNATANDNNGVAVYNTTEIRSNSINLTANNDKVDFGLTGTLNLGNKIWIDANNNGIFDAGEAPLAGINVGLFRDDNNDGIGDDPATPFMPIANATTDANGNYNFPNLSPGGYFVGILFPTKYVLTTIPSTGTNANNDVDNDNNLVRYVYGYAASNTVFLTAGGEPTTDGDGNNGNLTLDLGVYDPTAPCQNSLVFDDFATNATILNQVGGAAGNYSGPYTNTGSIGGNMTTTMIAPLGVNRITAETYNGSLYYSTASFDSISAVQIWDGDTNPAINPTGLGCKNLSPYQSIEFVYQGDRAVGVPITFELTLYSGANNVSKVSVTIPSQGNNVHQVVSIPLNGLTAVSGNGPVNLSCVGAIQLKESYYEVGGRAWDFGISGTKACSKAAPGSIGDLVFNDANANGIQDAGETGIAGVTVTLTNNNGTVIGTTDRKSTRLNSSHRNTSRMPSSA